VADDGVYPGMSADIVIVDRPEHDRYEVHLDGTVIGRADYVRRGDYVVIPHTQINPPHDGQGLGGQMVRFALEDIRERGLKVQPACPFVADFMAEHPEYADLL
jgi:predicted GNAT family acetyltransferase